VYLWAKLHLLKHFFDPLEKHPSAQFRQSPFFDPELFLLTDFLFAKHPLLIRKIPPVFQQSARFWFRAGSRTEGAVQPVRFWPPDVDNK
jgi:hypothetical protein